MALFWALFMLTLALNHSISRTPVLTTFGRILKIPVSEQICVILTHFGHFWAEISSRGARSTPSEVNGQGVSA